MKAISHVLVHRSHISFAGNISQFKENWPVNNKNLELGTIFAISWSTCKWNVQIALQKKQENWMIRRNMRSEGHHWRMYIRLAILCFSLEKKFRQNVELLLAINWIRKWIKYKLSLNLQMKCANCITKECRKKLMIQRNMKSIRLLSLSCISAFS